MAAGPKTLSKTRDSLRAVRSDLESIVKRLEAADDLSLQSFKALDTALRALAQQGDQDSDSAKARQEQLQTQINALKSHLSGMVRDTQRAVNSDLKTVLDDPRLATIAAAIDSANDRLQKTEAEQAQNLATVKSYIAELAREVDKTLTSERKVRQAALAAAQKKQDNLNADVSACLEKISTQEQTLKDASARMASIETDTATALQNVGDKVALFAQQAADARAEEGRVISGKISDIALETQKNFDLYKEGIDRNIEALQAAHETAKRDFHQDMDTLRTRLETLEYGLSPVQAQGITQTSPASLSVAAPLHDAFTPDITQDVPAPVTQPVTSASAAVLEHGGAPAPYIPDNNTADSANPYATMQNYESEPAMQAPGPYAAVQYQEPYHVPDSNALAQEGFNADPYGQLADTHTTSYGPIGETNTLHNTPVGEMQDTYPQTYDDMPYADPAYAETSPTMDQDRPGGPLNTGGGAKRSALFTPSNLRAAVLGVAVLGVGYVAFNQLTSRATTSNDLPSDVFVESQASDLVASGEGVVIPPIQTLEPIGTYVDDVNQTTDQASRTPNALEAAAAEGNAAAEYQLGLVKLQNGDADAALKLLRASANKGQAAAQYRLAKLYETGNGVTKDLQTARSLIEKAARNGNRIAMHDLANFYANGVGGVEQDLGLAAKWFEKAAERGVVDSQYNIGYLYEFGFGVAKNPVEAYVWYGIASAQGDTEANRRIIALNDTLSAVEIDSAKNRINGFKPVKIDQVANGIFGTQPWQSASSQSSLGPQVAQVQSLLNELGYSVGAADGQVGAKTRNAIIAFEKANGLPETGRINASLVDQLQLAAGV